LFLFLDFDWCQSLILCIFQATKLQYMSPKGSLEGGGSVKRAYPRTTVHRSGPVKQKLAKCKCSKATHACSLLVVSFVQCTMYVLHV